MLPVRPFRTALLLALAAALAPAPSRGAGEAAAVAPSRDYDECMALAQEAPEEAFERARVWETGGGGIAARHCAAVALINLEEFGEAATRLEALATDAPAGRPQLAAELLGQAGQAWSMADEVDRAYAAQTAALELTPESVELLIDRSVTLATAGDFWRAIDDLNRANEMAPARADVLVLRATAYRYVDGLELAVEDVERALQLEPRNPEALLERGILRRLTGDPDGARQDWLKVVTLAPGTPSAEAAQTNLAKLDLAVE